MAVPNTIAAKVVDLRYVGPPAENRFLVDTNVWYWQTYSRASQAESPPSYDKIKNYPSFLNRVLQRRGTLFHCGLALAELSILIERVEYEILARGDYRPDHKAYRNDPACRDVAIKAIEATWQQVEKLSARLPINLDEPLIREALELMRQYPLDCNDALMLAAARSAGVTNVVTDDSDFSAVPGFTVYTANRAVLKAAQSTESTG